jgi:hypothetical protein
MANTYAIARIIKRADDIALNDVQAKGLHILQARRLCDDLNRESRIATHSSGGEVYQDCAFHIVNLGAI